jgi:hypothetical protein
MSGWIRSKTREATKNDADEHEAVWVCARAGAMPKVEYWWYAEQYAYWMPKPPAPPPPGPVAIGSQSRKDG